MQYNTQKADAFAGIRTHQNMVDHALTIEDRAERQRCANNHYQHHG